MHQSSPFFPCTAFTRKHTSIALSFVCALSLFASAAIAQSNASLEYPSSASGAVEASSNTIARVGGSGSLFSDWVARSTVVVAGNNFNDALYATTKGTGYDGVAALFIERADGNFICTGSLLSGGLNILTAAHCLSNTDGVNITNRVTAVFFTPGQPASVREFITSSATYVNPAYTGEVIDAHDVAIVTLGAAPSLGILNSSYSLYLGDPFTKQARVVGSGATGTGSTGATQPGGFTLGDRRTGVNTVDFSWTDPRFNGAFDPGVDGFGFADPYGLVADFDDGTSAHNSSCILTSLAQFSWGSSARCGLGFGVNEVNLGGGDSGGPLFINGQLAGVASYGLSFGRGLGDIDGTLNSSFGEFSGWSSTAYNAAWITSMNTTVPEPGSFVLVGAGLFALVVIAKRRNRVS